MDASAIDLAKILPAFMAAQSDDVAFADALSAVIRLRAKRCEQIGIWDAISGMDEDILDYAAQALGIAWWRGDWSLAEKREMLGMAEQIRCGVNSHWALETLLKKWFGDPSLRVEEWFSYGGAPYTFRILTSSADVQRQLRFSRIMETVQRTSQSMDGIFVGFSMRGRVFIGAKGSDSRTERGEAVNYAYLPKGTAWAGDSDAYAALGAIIKATSPQIEDEFLPIDDADPDWDGVFGKDVSLCYSDTDGEVTAPATHERRERLDAAVARWWSAIGVEQDAPSIAYAWPPPQPVPAADLLSDLWCHLSFGETSAFDGTDDSASGNNFSNLGSSVDTSGKVGSCLSMTSGGQYARSVDDPYTKDGEGSPIYATNRSWSVSAWVKSTSTQAQETLAFCRAQSIQGHQPLVLGFLSGVPAVWRWGTPSDVLMSVGSSKADGTWHLMVYTHDATTHTASLYLDGSLAATASTASRDYRPYGGTSSEKITIGGSGTQSSTSWRGLLDEFAVWKRCIGQSEVTALYNGGAGLPFEEWT